MKKLLSIIMAAVLIATVFVGCSSKKENENKPQSNQTSESDLAYIKEKGTLVIGITEFEPMNYKDKDTKEWTGFDTEFAQAVAEKLGVKAEFQVIDWDNKVPELDAKSIDCLWNGMTITDEVKKNTNVTNAYVENAQVVVMKKSEVSKYSSLEDMKDLSFSAEAGSAGEKALQEAGIKNVTAVTAQSDCLTEVKSGSTDACVIDLTMANSMIGDGTSYSELAFEVKLNVEQYGIGFRKGSDVTEEVNKIMEEMKADGSLQKLADKYKLTLAK